MRKLSVLFAVLVLLFVTGAARAQSIDSRWGVMVEYDNDEDGTYAYSIIAQGDYTLGANNTYDGIDFYWVDVADATKLGSCTATHNPNDLTWKGDTDFQVNAGSDPLVAGHTYDVHPTLWYRDSNNELQFKIGGTTRILFR